MGRIGTCTDKINSIFLVLSIHASDSCILCIPTSTCIYGKCLHELHKMTDVVMVCLVETKH